MRRFIAKSLLILLTLVALILVYPEPALANVSKKFNVARNLFEKKRYKQSEKMLKAIIRQYPDHKASYYLLGRIAYRFGKSKKATKLFLKSGPSFLFTGGAFEYGITMFAAKRYNLAIKGLNRVPRNSPNRGIADFYIGVSYYNQKRFAQAENFLRRARKIPANLESSRRAFLREAGKQRELERAGRFTPQRPIYIPPPTQQYYYAPQPDGTPPPLPPGAGAPPPTQTTPDVAQKEVESKPEIKKGYSSAMTPRLDYTKQTAFKDKHGFGGTESNTQGISGGINGNFRYDNKSGSSYYLDLDLGFNNKTTTGSNIKNVVYEDDPGTIVATRSDVAAALDKSATIILKPGFDLPVAKSLALSGSFELEMSLPEMRFEEASQTRTPAGNIEVSFGDISLDLGASLTQIVTADGATADQKTSLTGDLDKPFETFNLSFSFGLTMVSTPAAATIGGFEQNMSIGATATKSFGDLSLKISGKNSQNTPPSGTVVGGTQSSNTFNGEASFPFEFGISFTAGGKFIMIDQYITPLSESVEGSEETTTVNVGASGQTTGFNATIKFAPISWLNLSASYSRDETAYTVGNKEKEADFQQNTPDIITGTSISIGVSQSF